MVTPASSLSAGTMASQADVNTYQAANGDTCLKPQCWSNGKPG